MKKIMAYFVYALSCVVMIMLEIARGISYCLYKVFGILYYRFMWLYETDIRKVESKIDYWYLGIKKE